MTMMLPYPNRCKTGNHPVLEQDLQVQVQRPLCPFPLQQCEGCMSRWCQCQMGPRWDQVTRNPFTSMVWWRKGTQFPTQRVLDAIHIWKRRAV